MKITKLVSKSRKSEKWVCTFDTHPQLETRAEWETRSSGKKSNPLFSFHVPPKSATEQKARRWEINVRDAFEVRREFLAIRTPEQAKAFFQRYGPMRTTARLSTEASPVRFSTVIERRDFYEGVFKRGLTSKGIQHAIESGYLNQDVGMIFRPEDPEVAIVPCKDVEDCLRATFALDKKKNFSLRTCAREECGKSFRLGRDKRKIYCSVKCARLQAQHAYLDRLNAEKSVKQRGR